MTTNLSVLHVLRLTLETVTPLSSSAGASLALQDNVLARDANGLPILLGTSLAGVLRHAYEAREGADSTKSLFGHEENQQKNGQASRLELSHGYVHDQSNRPVAGRLTRQEIEADTVLECLARDSPLRRDGVAIDHRGVATENQKFERASIPSGTRFTLELTLEGAPADRAEDHIRLRAIASLFNCPALRLGGATRRGLGKIKTLTDHTYIAGFDRSDKMGWDHYAAWRRQSISDQPGPGFTQITLAPPSIPDDLVTVTGAICFTFDGWWRFGQGERPLPSRALQGPSAAEPDQIPAQEVKIDYTGSVGRVSGHRITVAGSGIKGALAHRTLFHFRRMKGQWAMGKDQEDHPKAVTALFGSIKDSKQPQSQGQAGYVLIDDLSLDTERVQSGLITHNSIDRFTQGVRNRVLFTEQSLWQGTITIQITVLRPTQNAAGTDADGTDKDWKDACIALAYAIQDLMEGRLALGADSGDGHGYGAGTPCGGIKGWVEDLIRTNEKTSPASEAH